MRVAIVGVQNLIHMSALKSYFTFFSNYAISYDLIYLDKYGITENCGAEHYYKLVYRKSNLFSKFVKSILFATFSKRILKKNKYDFVVVWREQTAFLLSSFLVKYYPKKYSVNIRDLWDSKHYMDRRIKKACLTSLFNTIPSEGFLEYLNYSKFLLVPSVDYNSISKQHFPDFEIPVSGKIVIGNIGTFRNDAYYFSFVCAMNNDPRFEIRFIGEGTERMSDFCKANNITNVICEGAFNQDETLDKFCDIDIVNCACGNESVAEQTKLPIKYYYAVFIKRPCLSTEGTFVSKKLTENHMNIMIPNDLSNLSNLPDLIASKYYALNGSEMNKNLNELIQKYKNDSEEFKNKLLEVLIR